MLTKADWETIRHAGFFGLCAGVLLGYRWFDTFGEHARFTLMAGLTAAAITMVVLDARTEKRTQRASTPLDSRHR